MRIIAQDTFGKVHTTAGKIVRFTAKGVFVDNVCWCEPGNGCQILDVTEDNG